MSQGAKPQQAAQAGSPPRGPFARVFAGIIWIEDQLGGLLLLVASILVFTQIVIRFFGINLSGLYEIATFCALWSVFFTAGVGIQRNIHVRVDVIVMACPPRPAFVLKLASDLVVIIVTAVLCYSGYLLVEESLLFGDTTLGIISVPMWIPQLIMPLGGVLMLAHGIARFVATMRAGPAGTVDEPEADAAAAVMGL